MISVESHSKQIKLLNDYISALEKQVAAAKKEVEEHLKSTSQGSEDLKKLTDELNKFKNENGQLKMQIYRHEDNLKRLSGLERDYFIIKDQLEKEKKEKSALASNVHLCNQSNQELLQKVKLLEGSLALSADNFALEKKKLLAESEELRGSIIARERRCDQLGLLLVQEKKNATAKISSIEINTSDVIKLKNQSISKLTKQYQDFKVKFANEVTSSSEARNSLNQQIKGYVNKLNELTNQTANLKKENLDIGKALEKMTENAQTLQNRLNTTSNEYENFSKRTNDEKASLLKIVRGLEEDKRNLETLNASFKGNMSQNSKTLDETMKRIRQLTTKLQDSQSETQNLKKIQSQLQGKIAKIQTQSQDQRNSFSKENNQLLRQNNELQSSLNDLTRNSNALKVEQDRFIQEILAKLKESEQRNDKLREKVDAMEVEYKELNSRFQNDKLNLSYSQKEELEKLKNRCEKASAALTTEYEERLRKIEEKLSESLEQVQQKEKTIQQTQLQLSKRQGELKDIIENKEKENESLRAQFKQNSLSSIIDSQHKNNLKYEIEALKKSNEFLQASLKEHQNTMEVLAKEISNKEKEVEVLETSNSMLRKQVISAISNEEGSKKELLETKSKASSIMSNSHISIRDRRDSRGLTNTFGYGYGKNMRKDRSHSTIFKEQRLGTRVTDEMNGSLTEQRKMVESEFFTRQPNNL